MSQIVEGVISSLPHDAGEVGTPEWNVWALLLMIVREFIIDLLGSLLPGLLFVCFAGPLLAASLWLLWASITAALPGQNALPAFRLDVASYKSYLTLVTFALAYVLGCIFYRLDPKKPDIRSAERILNKILDEKTRSKDETTKQHLENELARQAIQATQGPNGRFDLKRESGAQFPYSHLYDYLYKRRLFHLAKLVPWSGTIDDGRTKMFINILKVRLQFSCPENCADIVRNEAHVRLMSSVWYAASTLEWVAAVAVLPGAAGVIIDSATGTHSLLRYLIGLGIACGAVALSAYVVQRAILRFLHYQRVREIVYVLEAVSFAQKRFPRILDDLMDYADIPQPESGTAGTTEISAPSLGVSQPTPDRKAEEPQATNPDVVVGADLAATDTLDRTVVQCETESPANSSATAGGS